MIVARSGSMIHGRHACCHARYARGSKNHEEIGDSPAAGGPFALVVSENSFKTRNRRHVRSRPMETPRGNREGVIDESEKIFDDVSHRIFETDRRLFSGVIGVVTRLRNQPRVAESSGRMLESV